MGPWDGLRGAITHFTVKSNLFCETQLQSLALQLSPFIAGIPSAGFPFYCKDTRFMAMHHGRWEDTITFYNSRVRKPAVNIRHTLSSLKETQLPPDMLCHSMFVCVMSTDRAAQAALLWHATPWLSLTPTINQAYNLNNSSLLQRHICSLNSKRCTMCFC